MEFKSTINVERGQTIGANLSLTNEQKVKKVTMEWEKIFLKFLDTADTKKTIELSLRHFFESKYQVDGRLKLPSSDKLLNFCSVIVSGVTFFSK